jgi:hypothetical protein
MGSSICSLFNPLHAKKISRLETPARLYFFAMSPVFDSVKEEKKDSSLALLNFAFVNC